MPIADPLELFRALNANVDAENYLAAARLCDPVSLRAFQRNTIADELPGIDTPAVLIAASADATFAAHLAAVSPRARCIAAHTRRLRRMAERMGRHSYRFCLTSRTFRLT